MWGSDYEILVFFGGLVGSLRLDGLPVVWGIIFCWYCSVSMTTVALPLSAGKMVMDGLQWSSCMAAVSSLVILDGAGLGWARMWATVERSSAASAVSVPMAVAAVSVAVMMSTIGGLGGVGRKARPLVRMSV
jgi:hypothetical protein